MSYLNPHTDNLNGDTSTRHEVRTPKTLAQMSAEIRQNNIEKGWRPADGGPGDNTWGDYIALLHSELSEALEAYRDHRLNDATGPRDEIWTATNPPVLHGWKPAKPEGVGSEFADVLIRLLDMADVFNLGPFDMDMELTDVAPVPTAPDSGATFGDWITWLHAEVTQTTPDGHVMALLLRAVVTATEHFGIDLTAEYERKVAYNRTRSYQHGGRTLADQRAVEVRG